jgi:hypothetical protein
MVGAQSVEGSALYTGSAINLPFFYKSCNRFTVSWLVERESLRSAKL